MEQLIRMRGIRRLVRGGVTPPSKLRGGWLLQFAPACVPIAVLALGAAYACENCSPTSLGRGVRHVWAIHVVDILLLAQLIGSVALVAVARGSRLISVALQAIWLWCSFWASFLGGMSMSGDWI